MGRNEKKFPDETRLERCTEQQQPQQEQVTVKEIYRRRLMNRGVFGYVDTPGLSESAMATPKKISSSL